MILYVWYRESCAARVFVDIYLLAVVYLGFIPRHTRVLSCVKYLCVPVCSYRHIEEDDNPEPLDTADDDGEQVGLGCDFFFCIFFVDLADDVFPIDFLRAGYVR